MSDEDAVRRYFGQPGYARFLVQLQRHYMTSSAGARGYVTLDNVTDEERFALDEFYGVYSPPIPNEAKRYSVKQFEKHLQRSRFALSIPDLLTILQGEAVRTQREMKDIADAEWNGMIHTEVAAAKLPREAERIGVWAIGLCDESSPGAHTLRRVYARSAEEAGNCLRCCLAALLALTRESVSKPVRLPILAAQVTGDAHALDWKYPMGRLFWWGLTTVNGRPLVDVNEADDGFASDSDSQAIAIREGYRRGGVADDDLSSQVMLYAPGLFEAAGETILTLRQVEQLTVTANVMRSPIVIYMVENPSVFAELVDVVLYRLREEAASAPWLVILCGNGQPSVAVIKLVDWLTGMDRCEALNYAGDMDPAGLSIAQGLQRRYPKVFRPWHLDTKHYLRYAHRGIPLSEGERNRMGQAGYDWDQELARHIVDRGVKLHQELWVTELAEELSIRLGVIPTDE